MVHRELHTHIHTDLINKVGCTHLYTWCKCSKKCILPYNFKELNEIFLKTILTQMTTAIIFSAVLLQSCKKVLSCEIKANKDHVQETRIPEWHSSNLKVRTLDITSIQLTLSDLQLKWLNSTRRCHSCTSLWQDYLVDENWKSHFPRGFWWT